MTVVAKVHVFTDDGIFINAICPRGPNYQEHVPGIDRDTVEYADTATFDTIANTLKVFVNYIRTQREAGIIL